MELKEYKCTNHEDIEAIIFCPQCRIYMCNKCKQMHSDLLKSHIAFNLDKKTKDIFIGICTDENHNVEYEYFCKKHNKLCCSKCISKIKNKGSGKHGDCDICIIEDIQNEKKEKLTENIKTLENLSKDLNTSIDEMKTKYEKICQYKEKLIVNIQKIFTQLRNKINKREEQILAKIERIFNKFFIKEGFLKTCETLPKKVKENMEEGIVTNKDWNENKLSLAINNCINIEKNIKIINAINAKIKKLKNKDIHINFFLENDEIYKKIENFEKINTKKFKYELKDCPLDAPDSKKYEIFNRGKNIIMKKGKKDWVGTTCEKKLRKRKIHCWKISIKKSFNNNIIVGIASENFDSSSYYKGGWFICLCCGCLYSGEPQNLKNEKVENFEFKNEYVLILDMPKKSLKILLNSKEKEIYSNIPNKKPLFPVIFLRDKNDTVEITDYYDEYQQSLKK